MVRLPDKPCHVKIPLALPGEKCVAEDDIDGVPRFIVRRNDGSAMLGADGAFAQMFNFAKPNSGTVHVACCIYFGFC